MCSLLWCRGPLLNPFQLREARTLMFVGVIMVVLRLFHDWLSCMLLWMYELVSIFVWVWNMNVVGRKSGEVRHTRPSEPVSPRRDLQEQIKAALELSLRRKPLFWARHYLAQARDARLSEDAWELWECCSCFSPSEEPHLWVRGCLAQARRAPLSEPCESLPMPYRDLA